MSIKVNKDTPIGALSMTHDCDVPEIPSDYEREGIHDFSRRTDKRPVMFSVSALADRIGQPLLKERVLRDERFQDLAGSHQSLRILLGDGRHDLGCSGPHSRASQWCPRNRSRFPPQRHDFAQWRFDDDRGSSSSCELISRSVSRQSRLPLSKRKRREGGAFALAP